jgi:hypothetical protein
MHLNPAAYAAHVFGGYNRLAVALGVVRWMPHKWAHRPKIQGGTGFVPCRYQPRLLEIAKERSLDLRAEDLVYGREVADADVARVRATHQPTPLPVPA